MPQPAPRQRTLEMNLVLLFVTALLLLVLPWDIAAQVGRASNGRLAPPEPMPLSAAIAEIRKSPFHSVAPSAGPLDGILWQATRHSVLAPDTDFLWYQEASEDTVVSSGRIFVATWSIGLLGYVVGGLVTFSQIYSDYWWLGVPIPITAVGVAAWGAGADPGRAAIGSILGGAIGVTLAFANPLLGISIGLVAHAAVTTLASKIHFRTRPRS